ncbi:hypothetical protein [Bosea robiniae]|uniref:Holliday junction resolvase RuvC n=1 Tax=Bosea robiniae TaxID=1036780 RepID=A0ABY0P455_9HYPH|nr:hypothetical protein [Bosea robiniae]SDH21888.1 hypothetical protein SAMN05421844_107191 [Bosea robiniae]
MTRIVALDLATIAGVAIERPDGSIRRETVDLCELAQVPKHKAARNHGRLFIALECLVDIILRGAEPGVIAIEDDTGRNKATAALLAGYRAIVTCAATKAGVRVISDMNASDARKLAGLPAGGTSKDVVTAKARRLFSIPATATDDEVDAEILLHATRARLAQEEFARLVKSKTKRTRRAA